jgi:hypothetical protein
MNQDKCPKSGAAVFGIFLCREQENSPIDAAFLRGSDSEEIQAH